MELILNLKKGNASSSCVIDFLQKISPNTFGPHCVSQKNEGHSHSHTSVETSRPASTDICPTPF